MSTLVERFHTGGPWMYLVLALIIMAISLPPIFAVIAAVRVRIPSLVWLLMPLLMVAVGIFGRAVGLWNMSQALDHVYPDQHDALLFAGLSIAPAPEWMALWGAAIALALTSLLLGFASMIGAGDGARWSWGPGLAALVIGALGWLGVSVGGLVALGNDAALAAAFSALLVVGGMGIVAAGLRSGTEDKDEQRTVATRALVAACTVLALAAALVASRMQHLMTLHQLMDLASPGALRELFALVLSGRAAATWIATAALAVALLAGAIPMLAAIRALLKPYALISGTVSVLAVGVLVVLHGVVWFQSYDLARDSALMRSLDLSAAVTVLPRPPDDASEGRITELDGALLWNGSGWTNLSTGFGGTEVPSMDYAGPRLGLLAMEADTPASVLVHPDTWGAREAFPQDIEILTQRPALEGTLNGPYMEWTRLGAVPFLWLAGGATGPTPVDAFTGASTWEEPPRKEEPIEVEPPPDALEDTGLLALLDIAAILSADPSFGDWPPIEESVYVLDGVGAPGSVDLGLPQDSAGIWLVASGVLPREIPRSDDGPRLLGEAVAMIDRPYVVFLPADTWTVQDLVTLCLAAVPYTPYDPYDYWSDHDGGADSTCAVDLALPFPEEGPRIQGFR